MRHVGLFFGRFDGRCLLMSFCKSIHSRWGWVSKAEPVFDVKLPMMILRKRLAPSYVEGRTRTYLTKSVKITTPPIKL